MATGPSGLPEPQQQSMESPVSRQPVLTGPLGRGVSRCVPRVDPALLPSPPTHPIMAELPDILFLHSPSAVSWVNCTAEKYTDAYFYPSFMDNLADVQVCLRPSSMTGAERTRDPCLLP